MTKKKLIISLKKKKPKYLIICAAKVGGILENNNNQINFLVDNFLIQRNLLLSAKKLKLKKIIYLGSSCVYPKFSKIPIKEDYLMSGKLEKTNEAYALAKICGIKICSSLYNDFNMDVTCLMPTNVYGENDNFDISSSHVIPGLISKFLYAKKYNKNVEIWGTGKPIREFLYVNDLAEAIVKVLNCSKKNIQKVSKDKLPLFNVGSGESLSIKKLVFLIKKITDFKGKIFFNKNFPDGTLNKNLDSSKIRKLGWRNKTKLKIGLTKVISEREN